MLTLTFALPIADAYDRTAVADAGNETADVDSALATMRNPARVLIYAEVAMRRCSRYGCCA